MTERHYWWSWKQKKMSAYELRKMMREMNASYALWEKIHSEAEKNHKSELEQAEEELTTRLSIL